MSAQSDQPFELAERKCEACDAGTPPLSNARINELAEQLPDGWNVVEQHHLEKEFDFDDFKTALDFVNRVGDLAESVGHHPDMYLSYGKVKITVWTHKIGGLAEADFVFAAKADRLYDA